MRSTCSVFVDAGYLLSSLASLETGTSFRNSIHVDFAQLTQRIYQHAALESGLPVLRINWYDAARNGLPDPQQQRIGHLPSVKLRLGRYGVDGTQKGVDLRMGLDLVAHARNRAGDVFFLMSGDDDLTEAVEEAQIHGVQVRLMAIPNKRGTANSVSNHLLRAADELLTLDISTFDGIVIKVEKPEVEAPQVEASAANLSSSTPKPSDLPRSRVLAQPRESALVWSSVSGGATRIYTSEPDITVTDEQIDEVVKNVLAAFRRTSPIEDQELLLLGKPTIPREIDRALLLDACTISGLDDLDDPIRMRLRSRFWAMAEA